MYVCTNGVFLWECLYLWEVERSLETHPLPTAGMAQKLALKQLPQNERAPNSELGSPNTKIKVKRSLMKILIKFLFDMNIK